MTNPTSDMPRTRPRLELADSDVRALSARLANDPDERQRFLARPVSYLEREGMVARTSGDLAWPYATSSGSDPAPKPLPPNVVNCVVAFCSFITSTQASKMLTQLEIAIIVALSGVGGEDKRAPLDAARLGALGV